jgi:hypothetical protein
MTKDPDERFVIEGDPEDALRSLLGDPLREYQVLIMESTRTTDAPRPAPGPTEPTPYFRSVSWTGPAASPEAAVAATWGAWDAKHDERPAAFTVETKQLPAS